MKRYELRQAARRASRLPCYAVEVVRNGRGWPPGGFTVQVDHDDCCRIWKGGPCSCAPVVHKPQAVEPLAAQRRKQPT